MICYGLGHMVAALHSRRNPLAHWIEVIDCEGVTGILKRQLLGNSRDYITTFQTFNRGTIQLDPHYFYATQ